MIKKYVLQEKTHKIFVGVLAAIKYLVMKVTCKCQRFNRIKQINNVIKDRDSRGFLIRFLNVIITRSSIVVEVFPFDRRISCNCIAKISHGERTECDERSHIVPGIVKLFKRLEENRFLEN